MIAHMNVFLFFFFNDTATTEIYTLSLHDALPIYSLSNSISVTDVPSNLRQLEQYARGLDIRQPQVSIRAKIILIDRTDRKSTRLNSSHANISYAVFCLKKKTSTTTALNTTHSYFT